MSDHFGTISITPPVSAKPAAKPARKPAKRHTGKSPERPGKASAQGKSRKWYFIIPILLLLPILYSIIGFWLAPWYFARTLTTGLNNSTGMSFSLEDVFFNPFSFKVSLQGIKLRPSDSKTESDDLLVIDQIEANLAPLSLLRNDLVSNTLHINGLTLSIIRTQDNHYNFEELLNGKSIGAPSDMMSFSELPFLFSLNNISIRESKVTFQDIPSATTHTLEDVELDLPTLSNFPFQVDEYIHPRFSTVINGSKIELTGQAAIPGAEGKDGLETKLSCNIHDLDLPLYSQYLPTSLPLALTKGKADGVLQLNFTRGTTEGPKMAITFSGELVDMELTNKDNSLSINLPNTSLQGIFQPISRALHIEKIIFRQPHFITGSAPTPEHLAFLLPFLGKTLRKEEASKPFPPVDIDLLQIENGDLAVASKEPAKKPSIAWNALQFSLKDFSSMQRLSSKDKKASFALSGATADAAMSFSWQGNFNDKNVPEGLFNLDNIPASVFFSGIGFKNGNVKAGKAQLQGTLSLSAGSSAGSKLITDMTNTEIDLQGLQLIFNKEVWLDAPRLKLSGFSKKDARIEFGSLRTEGAVLNLRRGNLPEVLNRFSTGKSQFSLNKIDFTGKMTLSGATGKPLVLDSVLLQADNLQSTAETKESLIFTAKIQEKGIIKAKGTARLRPFSTTLSTGFSGIDAKTLLPFFSDLPLLTDAQTTISGKGVLTLPATSFSGQLHVDKAVFSKEKNTLLSWNSAEVEGLSYTRTPFHLGILLLDIDQPIIKWNRDIDDPSPGEQWGSFLQGLLPQKAPTAAPTKESISISQLDIQEIRFRNGVLTYKDNRLTPALSTEISEFSGNLKDLHSASAKEQSHYSLSGSLFATPFSLEGTADFFSRKMTGQSTLKISNLPLSPFSKYLPDTLGIDGKSGDLSLDLSTSWNDDRATHTAHFLFKGVQAISTDTDANLTLALLKNSDGLVELITTPSANETETGKTLISGTVAAFQRQLIKTKVSPFLLASGDFTDLVGNEFADFQPGGFILSENGQKTLSRFTTFLTAHPAISLRITGCADTIIDGNALKKQLEEIEATRVSQENARRKAAWQHDLDLEMERRKAQQQASGKSRNTGSLPPPHVVSEFKPVHPQPVVIDDKMLEDLARERAVRVQSLLTGKLGIAPEKVIVESETKVRSEANNPHNRALIHLDAFTSAK